MKGNYSDWLIVSDIDGTLNSKMFSLPPNNKEAIRRFVDNGGNFTLCSGRNFQSLKPHYDKLNISTPAIILNGAGIYDVKAQRMINYTPISSEGEKIILDIISSTKGVELTIFDSEMLYLYKKSFYGLITSLFNKIDYKYIAKESDLPRGIWGKVSFFASKKKIKKLHNFFKSSPQNELFDCFLTSPFTLEVVNCGVNKGSAVTKLVEILNIDSANVGAIGDYYNDVDMLNAVSHPACCGQAPDDIKSLCEHVACHCNNGAVCDFINYIEQNYIL